MFLPHYISGCSHISPQDVLRPQVCSKYVHLTSQLQSGWSSFDCQWEAENLIFLVVFWLQLILLKKHCHILCYRRTARMLMSPVLWTTIRLAYWHAKKLLPWQWCFNLKPCSEKTLTELFIQLFFLFFFIYWIWFVWSMNSLHTMSACFKAARSAELVTVRLWEVLEMRPHGYLELFLVCCDGAL